MSNVKFNGIYGGNWIEPDHPKTWQECDQCGELVKINKNGVYLCRCGRVWDTVKGRVHKLCTSENIEHDDEYLPTNQRD